MTYKCCNCDNTLHTQGPINAFVMSAESPVRRLQVLLGDDQLELRHLDEFKAHFSKGEQDHVLQLRNEGEIVGAHANFTLNAMVIVGPTGTPIQQSIIICCEKCKRCCSYKK